MGLRKGKLGNHWMSDTCKDLHEVREQTLSWLGKKYSGKRELQDQGLWEENKIDRFKEEQKGQCSWSVVSKGERQRAGEMNRGTGTMHVRNLNFTTRMIAFHWGLLCFILTHSLERPVWLLCREWIIGIKNGRKTVSSKKLIWFPEIGRWERGVWWRQLQGRAGNWSQERKGVM